MWVAAVPRTWETAKPQLISWFPAGSGASAQAYPAPGTTIKPNTPITLTFSKPISKALGNTMPPVSPATAGSWHTLNDHSIVFRPEGYGYGLGAHVSIALPHDVTLVGGQQAGTSDAGRWSVPAGSTVRLQQLLATLGYLPLQFKPKDAAPAMTPSAQEDAAVNAPAGDFTWRYGNVPSALHGFWAPGAAGVMTRGRADGVRERQRPDSRRDRRSAGLEGADRRRRQGQGLHVRLHVRVGQRGLAVARTCGTTGTRC